MDHRWDDRIRREREARAERERYGAARIERDENVERRDRQVLEERRQKSYTPWSIGESHWDQRDLYTRDSRTEAEGYGRGPAMHPDIGSYAYHNDVVAPPSSNRLPPSELYEREAWPWLHYFDDPAAHGKLPVWERMKRKFFGKGPKNWTRSSARIREDACEALAYHGELDATDIEVEVHETEVTLKGTVPDRYSKKLAERIVESVHGVTDVHNRLEVHRHDDPTDTDVSFVMPAKSFA